MLIFEHELLLLCTLHSLSLRHDKTSFLEQLRSTVNLSNRETVHCNSTAENDVNVNLTYFYPMGVARLKLCLCRSWHMETHAF